MHRFVRQILLILKNNIQILLVEDDADDVELLQIAFSDKNVNAMFTVLCQGDKVLPHLAASGAGPDIILLDLNLPKMHGKEILQAIKSDTRFAHIPVIMLTTSSAQTDREFCLKAGAANYFVKPIMLEEYYQMVGYIVRTAEKVNIDPE